MKKNVMMRVASVLLVAVLMSTCVISGTFAKYVTSDDATDSARVAKWGVVVDVENYQLFTENYETDAANTTFTGNYSVSSNSEKLLAPGTSGEFADIAITGTPEVAVDVAIVATVSISDNWVVDEKFYCPLIITVGETKFDGKNYTSAAEFADAIKEEIDGKSSQYAPGTNLAETYANTNLDLSWEWAYGNEDETTESDIKDTKLGDAAVDNDLTVAIGLTITVTQID